MSDPVLTALLSQVERTFDDGGDVSREAEALATAYPQYVDDLFAFADALLSSDDPLPPGMGGQAVRDTLAWLGEEHHIAPASICSCGEWLDASGACPIRLYPTCRTPLDAVNERAEKRG